MLAREMVVIKVNSSRSTSASSRHVVVITATRWQTTRTFMVDIKDRSSDSASVSLSESVKSVRIT